MAVLDRFYCSNCLTLCPLGILDVFLSSADFFSKSIFSKISFRNTIRVSSSLGPDDLGLIWVQTVCRGYQQVILVGKDLKWNLPNDNPFYQQIICWQKLKIVHDLLIAHAFRV